HAALLLLVALTPPAAWIVRNAAVFSLPRLSNADAIMEVYFAGAGAYQVEHGLTLEEAQARISKEYDLPPPEVTNNHWVTDQPGAEMDAKLRAAAFPVLTKYPKALVVSSALAIIKSGFSHNAGVLAQAMGREWIPPGAGDLLRGDRAALSRLAQNGPLPGGVFL